MPPRRNTPNLSGRRFTRLFVVGPGPYHPRKKLWECRCDCGAVRYVTGQNLERGDTKSCGCWTKDRLTKHSQSGVRLTAEYVAWKNMKTRCLNPRQRWAKWYGGRITICQAWLDSFAAFFADVGPKPSPTHTLERKDNDGPYEPGNVVWATWSEQRANRRPHGSVA